MEICNLIILATVDIINRNKLVELIVTFIINKELRCLSVPVNCISFLDNFIILICRILILS